MNQEREKLKERFLQEYKNLNEAQKKAVDTIDGPVLVIAGPGTGKTQILGARIARILELDDVYPNNILCLTYTDAGSIKMRERLFNKFIGSEAYKVEIHTFHSFCNKVIQENSYYFSNKNLRTISELEQIEILYEIIDELEQGNALRKLTGDIYSSANSLKYLFETIKKENFDTNELILNCDNYIKSLPENELYIYQKNGKDFKKGDLKQKAIDAETEKIEKLKAALVLFQVYNKKMTDKNLYDFNDMINWVIKAFQTHDELLGKYQEQFQYILVDEYQDTNGSQNDILYLLASYYDNPNVFAVGDDDQSIYSFQGANTERIKDFVHKYKESLTSVVLTQNYRSSQLVLDASKTLIEYNNSRLIYDEELNKLYLEKENKTLSKDIVASNQEFLNVTDNIEITAYSNVLHEEAAIVQKIHKAFLNNENLAEIAIIYRNHKNVENIVKLFQKHKIPFNAKLSYNVLDEPIIRQLINILTYLIYEKEIPNGNENLLFEIMHYEYFGIDIKDIALMARSLADNRKEHKNGIWRDVIGSPEKMLKMGLVNSTKISALDKNLNKWHQQLHTETIQVLFENILNYGGILHFVMNNPEKIHLLECINSFFDFMKDEYAKNPKMKPEEFLEMLNKMSRNNIKINKQKIFHAEKGVNLVTAHSSKGLEFETVFLINCNSENWEKKRKPSNSFNLKPEITLSAGSENDENYEEERRLFYVAMTRAKKHLLISYQMMKLTDKDVDSATLQRSVFVSNILDRYKVEVAIVNLESAILSDYTISILQKPTIDGHMLENNYLEKILENYKLSATHLNKFLKCPLAFYYENILRVPSARNDSMGFGSAVHHALDKLFKALKTENDHFPAPNEFISYFIEGININASHFTDKQKERRIEFGKEVLPKYYEKYQNTWVKNVITEKHISTTIEGVPVSGVFDKVELLENNRVNVIDYKTGDPDNGLKKLNRSNAKDPNGGDYWRQLVFYKLLIENEPKLDWYMEKGVIDFIQPSKKNNDFVKEEEIITPEDVAFVKNQIKDSYQKIKNKEFTEGCGAEDCSWCNFTKYLKKEDAHKDIAVGELESE
jgi:DNA helicase II / ATP-dependent DNA helicase PcrA